MSQRKLAEKRNFWYVSYMERSREYARWPAPEPLSARSGEEPPRSILRSLKPQNPLKTLIPGERIQENPNSKGRHDAAIPRRTAAI
jgi:hypothetical protein